ncbi:phosphomannomutase/phosphoglucomutase [Candidatus Micrarchaeota archaeon]|nr:phosphomannomutase/phosphoglucomutase [Candidatus Micrarchaeota archaeon]
MSIFGGYDIRGIYPNDLDANKAKKLGQAFALQCKNACVGFDNRSSSQELKNAFLDGFVKSGGRATIVGLVPTPVLYYSIVKFSSGGGVMVTASHLPAEYNGFKFLKKTMPLATNELKKLEEDFNSDASTSGEGGVEEKSVEVHYVNHVLSKTRLGRELKIVLDSGNGVCGPLAKRLFEELGCEVIGLFIEPDSRFPNHVPDPHKTETLKWLCDSVKKEKADLGIALDADGDRCLFVDDLGKPVPGDYSNVLFALSELRKNPSASVVGELRSSMVFKKEVEANGGKYFEAKAGRVAVREEMVKQNAVFSGEITGHVCFKENYGFDDGIFAAAKMLELLSNQSKKLSELISVIPKYSSSPEYRVNVKNKQEIITSIKQSFTGKGLKFSELDGVKLVTPNSWGLVRVSNTEEKITLRFEGETEKEMLEVKKLFSDELSKLGVALP